MKIAYFSYLILILQASYVYAANPVDNLNTNNTNINSKIKPVIVEIYDKAINETKTYMKQDSRILNESKEWGYLSGKFLGTIQNLEYKHKFISKHAFNRVLKGFSADLTTDQINELAKNPAVKSIEPDYIVHTTSQITPWGIYAVNANISSSLSGNNIGVTRGSNVYVLDTGNPEKHPDLFTKDFLAFGFRAKYDCNGHSTHVSGTIAALDNNTHVVGVAPSIPLTSIKVLGCTGSGSVSNIIKAIDWVSANGVKPAIINMSLGSVESLAMDTAVENAVTNGITVVVAAGNSATDACTSSPARMGRLNGVITVAAIDNTGSEAWFSNYGECVDIWAPGVNILSTSMNGGTTTMSGTSMATPHVVGVVSLYLAKSSNSNPSMVEQSLKNDAIVNGKQSKDGTSIKVVNSANY